MGKVNILYSHRLGEMTGRPSEVVEVETPLSVHDLICRLTDRYGPVFGEEINLTATELGERSNFYFVFVDGKKVQENEKDAPVIDHQSEVSFLPLVSGG